MSTFQVDLRGMVDLLSRNLYSGPRVYVRELLQNCVDAISARRELDPQAPARISFTIEGNTLTLRRHRHWLNRAGGGHTPIHHWCLLQTRRAGPGRSDFWANSVSGCCPALWSAPKLMCAHAQLKTPNAPTRALAGTH